MEFTISYEIDKQELTNFIKENKNLIEKNHLRLSIKDIIEDYIKNELDIDFEKENVIFDNLMKITDEIISELIIL